MAELRVRQTGALIASSMGAAEVDIPDTETEIARFDAALLDDTPVVPRDPVDIERVELLTALGLPVHPWR